MKPLLLSCLLVISFVAQAQTTTRVPEGGFPINQDRLKRTGTGWIDISLRALDESIKDIKWTALPGKPLIFPSSIPLVQDLQEVLERKANAANIYDKTASDLRYRKAIDPIRFNEVIEQPLAYPSTIDLVTALKDSLKKKLDVVQYQAFITNAASTTNTYTSEQVNQILLGYASKISTLEGYNAINSRIDAGTYAKSITFGPSAIDKTGQTDATQAIQASLNSPGIASTMFVPDGDYLTSSYIFVPSNVNLVLSPKARFIAAGNFPQTTFNGNDAGYFFILGSGSTISGGVLDGKGFDVGGVSMIGQVGSKVEGMMIKNWTGARFGIAMIGSQNCAANYNRLYDGVHSINGFRSFNCRTTGNYGNRLESFIYAVAATGFYMYLDAGFNCKDVIFDLERCQSSGGRNLFAQGGNRGEYAFFSGGPENADQPAQRDLLFSNSYAYRTYTYQLPNPLGGVQQIDSVEVKRGACAIHSLASGAYNVGFENMNIFVERGYAFSHPQFGDKSNRYAFFRNSTVHSKAGFLDTEDSDGLQITGNTFEGLPGSESVQNIVRDAHGLVLDNNTFRYVNPKVNNPVIWLLTISNFAQKAPRISRNRFFNTGTLAFKVDLYNNGGLGPVLSENRFSEVYVSNGGLEVTDNGSAIYRDQKLKLLIPDGNKDFTTFPFIKNMGAGYGAGSLVYGWNGYQGTTATLGFGRQDNGETFLGIQVLSTRSYLGVSASGSTLQLSNTTGAPIGTGSAKLDITLNSN